MPTLTFYRISSPIKGPDIAKSMRTFGKGIQEIRVAKKSITTSFDRIFDTTIKTISNGDNRVHLNSHTKCRVALVHDPTKSPSKHKTPKPTHRPKRPTSPDNSQNIDCPTNCFFNPITQQLEREPQETIDRRNEEKTRRMIAWYRFEMDSFYYV
jgi:hypothetical protein